jgi:hypothetical protein
MSLPSRVLPWLAGQHPDEVFENLLKWWRESGLGQTILKALLPFVTWQERLQDNLSKSVLFQPFDEKILKDLVRGVVRQAKEELSRGVT